jgi:GAF domain-containing protein
MARQLAMTLHALADVLQKQRTLGGTLAGIAEAATVSVPCCDAASVALSIEGRPATAAATARIALELDVAQYESGEGPCLAAFNDGSSLRLDLVESDEPFPHFARAARDRGVVAVLSLPVMWDEQIVATLNLYSRSGPFGDDAAAVAAVLGAQVAMAVSRSPEFTVARAVVERAQQDIDDQAEVNVATGLLMANEECSAQQAEGLLSGAAAHNEESLVAVARRIIEQHHASP